MHDLIAVTAGWGVIALGVAGLYVFGRDPKAGEHDLSDYHEPVPVNDDGVHVPAANATATPPSAGTSRTTTSGPTTTSCRRRRPA